MQVTRVTDIGNGQVLFEGADNGQTVSCTGWLTDVREFYPPDQHDEQGALIEGAVSRPMTAAELESHAGQVLAIQGTPTTGVLWEVS
jgi:hypothetical protein